MATDLEIINSALTKIGAGIITAAQLTAGSTKEARLASERLSPLRLALLRSHPWNIATKRADSTTITSTGAHGSGTIAVSALTSALPNLLAITFSGGGILTLNAAAAVGAIELSGTISAGIASAETASTWTSVGSALANTAPDFEYSYSVPFPTDFVRLLDVYNLDKEYRVEAGNIISNSTTPDILYIYDLPLTSSAETSKWTDPSLNEALSAALAVEMAYPITQSQGVFEIAQVTYKKALADAKTNDAQEDGRYHVQAELFDDSRYGSSIFTDYRNHYRP